MSTLSKAIVLTIFLSFCALLMEADQSLYKIIGIPSEETQSNIRIAAFIITLAFGTAFLLFEYKSDQKNFDSLLESTLESIFITFFETAPIKDVHTIFRVNLYKFYESGTVKWRYHQYIRNREYKKTTAKKDRRLEIDKDYLLCFKRYGYKHGKQISHVTTYPFKIDSDKPVYRLFTGKVYESGKFTTIEIDNYDINDIVRKIPDPDHPQRKIYNSLLDESWEENFKCLLKNSIIPSNCLDQTEIDRLKNFMERTNTLASDLFNINHGVHCNHFMGFKIIKKSKVLGDIIWGVVTIDALQPNRSSFYEFIGVDHRAPDNSQWLEKILKAYSKLLSDAINKHD